MKALHTSLHETLASDITAGLGIPLNDLMSHSAFWPSCDKDLVRALDEGAEDYEGVIPENVRDLRTLLQYTYKLKVMPLKEQQHETIQGFLRRNDECRAYTCALASDLRKKVNCQDSDLGRILRIAQNLCYRRTVSYRVPGLPSHGPGTTLHRHRLLFEKYESLERDVPAPTWRRMKDMFRPTPVDSLIEPYNTVAECRLACVPKDARGPRLVAPHLVSQMWCQQAVGRALSDLLVRQKRWYKYHLPSDSMVSCINFDDQSVNSSLALYASANPGMYATLDMSDCSDLISYGLVAFLFSRTRLLQDLGAVRARYVRAHGSLHKLYMHAPMGSACCFPVMSLVMWALCVACCIVARREDFRSGDFSVPGVFVFGDDIILPTDCAEYVCNALPLFGLKPNKAKSYYGLGGFRESCGCDAYKGVDITPLRLKTGGVSSVSDVASLIEMVNHLVQRGYLSTADCLLDYLEANHRELICATNDSQYPFCVYAPTFDAAMRINSRLGRRVRWNRGLQRHEVQCAFSRASQVVIRHDLDSRARLYQSLTGRPIRSWSGNRPVARRSWVPIWNLM
jgi:hypothetical protein